MYGQITSSNDFDIPVGRRHFKDVTAVELNKCSERVSYLIRIHRQPKVAVFVKDPDSLLPLSTSQAPCVPSDVRNWQFRFGRCLMRRSREILSLRVGSISKKSRRPKKTMKENNTFTV